MTGPFSNNINKSARYGEGVGRPKWPALVIAGVVVVGAFALVGLVNFVGDEAQGMNGGSDSTEATTTSTTTSTATYTLPKDGEYQSLFYAKFHKVGSSTAAVRLGAAAQLVGFEEDCEHGGVDSFCVEHRSLHIMRNGTVGTEPITRILAFFPNPLLITILREPMGKFMSYIYYKAWRESQDPTEEWFYENREFLWNMTAEYSKVLCCVGTELSCEFGRSDGRADVPTGVRVLDDFHVVGITEDMPGTMAQVAYHLKLKAEDMAYMSVTTMPDRPGLEDLSYKFQKEAYRLMAETYPYEMVFYKRAEILHNERLAKYDLYDMRDEIEQLSKDPDQMDCEEKVHEPGVSAGGKTCIDPNAKDGH